MKSEDENGDVMLVGPEVAGGRLAAKYTETHIEVGVLAPLQEGKPVTGELVRVKPRGRGPLCDVETVTHKGPSRTSSPNFRKGWGRVFGGGKSLPN